MFAGATSEKSLPPIETCCSHSPKFGPMLASSRRPDSGIYVKLPFQ
jgi:hypothetical protein